MLLDLVEIESSHCSFTIQDQTKLTVGFYSRILLKYFLIRVNFGHGLEKVRTYQSCVDVLANIGACPTESQIRSLVEKSDKGWGFIRSFIQNVDGFMKEQEAQLGDN